MLHFSARIDESDTHDRSIYTVIGGAVATVDQWVTLETRWRNLLEKYRVRSFHYKDFEARQDDFYGWGPLKARRFMDRAEKVIDENVAFRVAVGIDPRVHTDVKKRMRSIKGFRGDSEYGLCLRWLLFQVCEHLSKVVNDDFTVSVVMEDGPYAAGAIDLFHRLRAMTGKHGGKHAAKYGEIATLGKENLSLQAADAIVGIEADLITRPSSRRSNRLRGILASEELEYWYEGMIKEKERRRAYHQQRRARHNVGTEPLD